MEDVHLLYDPVQLSGADRIDPVSDESSDGRCFKICERVHVGDDTVDLIVCVISGYGKREGTNDRREWPVPSYTVSNPFTDLLCIL